MISPFDKNSAFYNHKFEHLQISDETVSDKEFEQCTFEKCSFVSVTFNNCRFLDCRFIECTLSAIKPMNCSFTETKFKDSKVIGFDWTKAKAIRAIEFDKCQINYSNFTLLKLHKLLLKNCEAHEVEFSEADLTEADMQGTDFENARFNKTNLTKANFINAKNYLIDFKNNTLTKAKFKMPEAISLLKSLDVVLEY